MNTQQIIDLEQQYVLGVYGRPPMVFASGEGATLTDADGKSYLDCVSGIAVNALGYGDPDMKAAIMEVVESGVYHVSNLYHTAPHARLAQKLCEHSFADKVHYCLTGADANEGAFKFARRYAYDKDYEEKYSILAFSDGFHGRLFGSLAATPRPKYQDPFKPLMPGVRFALYNDLDSARELVDERVCAIIVEPIQGEGGVNVATPEFLKGLRELADEYDAMLIFDEVQCGMGRTGSLWGYQSIVGDEIAPDIMTLAKSLAGGLPIGAICMNQKVADMIHPGDHASTFAGSPLTTNVACTVLDRIAQPEFLASVQNKGEHLRDLLAELNSPHITEIRGRGLITGVEMDIDVTPVVDQGYEQGLLTVSAGTNILRYVPPFIITEEELERAVKITGNILQGL
ncbi:MAG: acetylornithine/succinylornithine family transaminase [Caldilineaceae bacterium SB0662_bin_9]|uniref:Acetylornithine/succinylornithine family transaminase n=1 Tax=Caldilineaceae bacterium SB0662_bin_9 TaxID=2605258 RepID=A0A6B1DXX1_9CHLR|nr:acetylornithine/succinylornithine family transaminase [Caldilineaceae bacterium]MXZ43219.1 acetylornithine/succinylornithine family transaminase [Caldilineaceae bacterium SB0666_bin_21]MYD91605.1 acetylornithine/succinylornithine family transaminase [Caldilineaceae bacterium SB0662_bin_9]